ncbi:MAG TPA: hypothetical protein VFZ78_11300 [Flavisolibacter sp.]
MRKYLLTFFVLAGVILFSCQQDVNSIINQAQQCRIASSNYYGGGGVNDSATYFYDVNNKLIKVENMDGYYTYFYSGDRIVKRTYHDNMANDLWYIDSVYYSSGNTISELVRYDYSGQWADTIHNRILFHYQNGKMSNLTYLDYYTLWGVNYVDTMKVNVVWNGANNIDKIVYLDMGQPVDSILYQYDTNPNYFRVVHPNFFLHEPQLQLYTGLEPHFAYYYSANNVINSNMYGSFDYPVDYGLDSTNKITSIDMGGFPYISYKYQCP